MGLQRKIGCNSGTPTYISNGCIIATRETIAQKNPPALPEITKAGGLHNLLLR
jgi:hypothetical protein